MAGVSQSIVDLITPKRANYRAYNWVSTFHCICFWIFLAINHRTTRIPRPHISRIQTLTCKAPCLVGQHHPHPCMRTYPHYVGFDFVFLGLILLRTRRYPDGLPAGYPSSQFYRTTSPWSWSCWRLFVHLSAVSRVFPPDAVDSHLIQD